LLDEIDPDVDLVVQVAASPASRREMSRIAKGAWSNGRDRVPIALYQGPQQLPVTHAWPKTSEP